MAIINFTLLELITDSKRRISLPTIKLLLAIKLFVIVGIYS